MNTGIGHENKFWPSDNDRLAREARFHVPRSPLTAPADEYVPGISAITITETPADVEERLTDAYPLYRFAKLSANLIRRSTSDEV
jgi:hypothetical protein